MSFNGNIDNYNRRDRHNELSSSIFWNGRIIVSADKKYLVALSRPSQLDLCESKMKTSPAKNKISDNETKF